MRLTTRAGGAAIRRSVFQRLPGKGRWGTVLLADGDIGIGGDPVAVLRRCEVTPWFDWAHVGVDAVVGSAARAGLDLLDSWRVEQRWFAFLAR